MFESTLLYENSPELLDVGGFNTKVSPFEYIRFAMVKFVIVGDALVIVNVAVVVVAV